MAPSGLTYRRLTVALVVALVAVAVLAGVGPSFPRDVAAGTAWRFLTTDAVALAHALLGAVALAGVTLLVVRAPGKLVPSLVLVGAGLSVVSGVWYVQGHQPESALTTMTIGWLTSLIGSIIELVRARRRPAAVAGGRGRTAKLRRPTDTSNS